MGAAVQAAGRGAVARLWAVPGAVSATPLTVIGLPLIPAVTATAAAATAANRRRWGKFL